MIVVAGPVVATLVSTFLFFFTAKKVDEAANWVKHTVKVQENAATLLGLLTDTETGMRGYLLTKDPKFLDVRDQAIKALPQAVTELGALLNDDPTQSRRVRLTIAPLVQRRVQLEEDAYDTFQKKNAMTREIYPILEAGKHLHARGAAGRDAVHGRRESPPRPPRSPRHNAEKPDGLGHSLERRNRSAPRCRLDPRPDQGHRGPNRGNPLRH
ncbi:MAG: CHASE3 domain-containing protein [Verrucomicrobiota bacterium]|nr:CHASE3 domain-containing protein [Verrucomicrobiota bacterium]